MTPNQACRNSGLRRSLRRLPLAFACFLLPFVLVAGAVEVRAGEMNRPLPNEIKAGPIWNDGDAAKKCPKVCAQVGSPWSGLWRTTVWGTMSVCSCGGPSHILGVPAPSGPGSSCSAPANAACGGCAVQCPPGKQALCKEGEDHGVTSPLCWTQAKCECQ
jgi:Mannan-binding protein